MNVDIMLTMSGYVIYVYIYTDNDMLYTLVIGKTGNKT